MENETKRNNPYAYPLKKYREALLKYQEFEEVEEALRIDPGKINLRHVFFFSAWYNGMRTGMIKLAEEEFLPAIKGENRVYAKATLDLITSSIDNVHLYMEGHRIGFRNHERKGNKLVKCEAYFYDNVTIKKEIK